MTVKSLLELNDEQVRQVIEELKDFNKDLPGGFEELLSKIDISPQEALEYLVCNDPKTWAKVYLDWEARDYQIEILDQGKKSKKLVLRLGRRLSGKLNVCVS